eukprot:CAMPEP_0172439436 /NCGR_PEP_ID=MMETSP1065-20121228/426_1 /TAXON_ID=265537 /ORGANISM="Amphiprora paludosa, Strain CCMP125" /LENGTH=324 /DNA_ID=CAMNT_0013188119 /DNA_START=1606 /DNA_END=2580 /DNA_ORIENTATION=-
MKISAFAILSIMGTAAAAATDKAVINIKCQDMDWEMLTFAEQNYAADAVERAFNHVSGTDHEMNRVQWVPASSANLLGLGHFDGQIVRPEGAVKDDNCWLCLDDDDSFVKEGSNSRQGEQMQLWQNQLEYYFQEGPYSAFARAHECQIGVEIANPKSAVKGMIQDNMEKSQGGSPTVMDVQCHNLDWAKLTSTEKTFVAANLARSFNAVSGNKKQLTGTSWEALRVTEPTVVGMFLGLALGERVGQFSGMLTGNVKDDNCWLCLDDDDSFKTMRGSSNSNMEAAFLERWALELERNIQEGPYSSLSHAFDCDIAMVAELIPLSH